MTVEDPYSEIYEELEICVDSQNQCFWLDYRNPFDYADLMVRLEMTECKRYAKKIGLLRKGRFVRYHRYTLDFFRVRVPYDRDHITNRVGDLITRLSVFVKGQWNIVCYTRVDSRVSDAICEFRFSNEDDAFMFRMMV